jgi:hypothetical protein
MSKPPTAPTSLLQERQIALRQKMAHQHPFHEEMAQAYERIGGLDALTEWAEDNPGKFFELMMKAAPIPPAPPGKPQGTMTLNLSLHPSLAPGPLDVTPVYDQLPEPNTDG